MPFVDFAELKTRVSIEQAIPQLGLNLTLHGNQYRGACPTCQTGGDRALVITPSKGLFYCFAKRSGGDQIALTAHIKGVSLSDAASFLGGNRIVPIPRNITVPVTLPPTPAGRKPGFDPEAYAARLDPAHASLGSLGLSAETLRTFKAGFALAGSNRGRLALPLHNRDGKLIGYCGRSLKEESHCWSSPMASTRMSLSSMPIESLRANSIWCAIRSKF